MLPLYNGFQNRSQLNKSKNHPGLLFDKFPDGWACDWHDKLPENVKKNFLYDFVKGDYNYLKKGLNKKLQKQGALVEHLSGTDIYVKTDWRFISGLGSGHPYETGFIWHRTLGVPYIPGSAVKGMMRAWAEQWCQKKAEIVTRLFAAPENNDNEAGAGSLIVFDALPVQPPKLELDILNPHYGPYYESAGDKPKPPADYYSPVPIFFLTVAPNQSFRFSLAPRPSANNKDVKADLEKGITLLNEALLTLGAGGKTAVGYGVFQPDPQGDENAEKRHLKAKEKEMPRKDRWRSELSRLDPEQLVARFSRNWNKTKKRFGDDFEPYLAIVREVHGEAIRTWQNSTNKNKKKAFNKLYPLG